MFHLNEFILLKQIYLGYSTEQFLLLDERGLKAELVGKDYPATGQVGKVVPAAGQVSKMMGSTEEANRFLALMDRKIEMVVKKPEIWNNLSDCSKKSPEEVWCGFKRLWNKYT